MKKILLIFMVLIALTACKQKKEAEKPVDDFLKVPTYAATPSAPAPQIVYVDRETREIVTDSTYWFVILDEQTKNGGSTSWHKVITLPTPYFDFYLARKNFKRADGKSFFEFILKVNREARDSYWKYAADSLM